MSPGKQLNVRVSLNVFEAVKARASHLGLREGDYLSRLVEADCRAAEFLAATRAALRFGREFHHVFADAEDTSR